MNYRHAYHAGNFADVLKHAVLALVIEHLKQKPAPFRVIDTHAGAGLYDLEDEAAQKTGEWREGIGRLWGNDAKPLPLDVMPLLAPYLAEVARLNPGGILKRYPGSPLLALELMRADDQLVANELHPEDARTLKAVLAHDRRAKVLGIDAWVALKSLLPPKERRAVVLVDPPFEEAGELERLGVGLSEALKRFATGTYVLWFPVKEPATVARLAKALPSAADGKLLLAELRVRSLEGAIKLSGTGLAVFNPPYKMAEQLQTLLPFLAERLAQGPGALGSVLDGAAKIAAAGATPVGGDARPRPAGPGAAKVRS